MERYICVLRALLKEEIGTKVLRQVSDGPRCA